MEMKIEIGRKWKMVVAVMIGVAVIFGTGLGRKDRSVEGEPDVISSIIMNNEQYLTVVANRNEIENEEEFKKHPIFSHYVFRYNSYHIFGYD